MAAAPTPTPTPTPMAVELEELLSVSGAAVADGVLVTDANVATVALAMLEVVSVVPAEVAVEDAAEEVD